MPKTESVEERTQLQRLKWGMMLAPLLLLAPYEAYNLLVVKIHWHEALLDVLVVMAGSFVLMQVSFSIIFRLQGRSMQQQKRLAVVHQVDAQLSASLDPQRVIEAVLEGALSLTSAAGARVFAYDPERREFAAGWERPASGECYPVDYRPRPNGFNARVVRTGEPLVIEDVASHPSLLSTEDLAQGVKAAAGIPLLHGDQVLGILSVGFATPRTFTEDELETLRLLAGRAAVALENARQYQRAEAAEARFRDVALSSADWVWEVDAQGRYTYCSKNVANVLGYTHEEVLGKTSFEFMPPDEMARVSEIFAGIAANRQPIVGLENHSLTKDGREVVLLTNGVPILDSEGNLLGYRGVDKDITERKRAEAKLREAERRFRTLLDNVKLVAVGLDQEGNIAYANSYLLELTGYTSNKVLKKNWFQTFVPERDRPAVGMVFSEILEAGVQPHHENPILTKSGEERLIAWNNTLLLDENASPMGTMSIGEDITERVRVEQALQRRNLELAALNSVSQALSSSLELQDLVDEALSRVLHAMEFTGGLICLADEKTGALALCSHKGLPPPLVEHLEAHGLSGTLCDFVYQEGTPLGLEDLRESAPVDVGGLLKVGLQSYVGAPIVHQDRILGTFCLFGTAPHPISESDYALLTAIGQQIGVAVENARLFRRVAREHEVAQTLLDTAETLSATLRLDQLLERVLDELQRVVPYDKASISLLRDERYQIVASRGLKRVPYAQEEHVLAESPLVQRIVHGRGPVIVPDVHDEPDWLPVEGLELVRSWLGVPLISKDEVIGVLMVDSHHPNTYDKDASRLALTFAHQVAMAMENSRLYGQTRAQLRETTLLHSVTAALSSTLDLSQILPYVARSLCEILNSTGTEIYSLDEEANTITVVAEYTIPRSVEDELPSDLGRTYPLADFPATAEALAQRRPMQVQVDNPEADPRERAELKAHGVLASLLLPMVARDRVVGFAKVWESQGSRRFTQGEIAMGQTLIHQAATAIENARLFEETQHRVRELRLLHDVGLAAASGVRLEETLQAAAEALVAELQDTRIALMLLEPESGTLRVKASAGYPEAIKDLHLQSGEGITGWVAQHGEPALVPDVRLDPRYVAGDPDTRSELCVPLVAGPLVIGVLNVESPQPNTFTDDDLRLLSTLTSNLTMLVERARLFEEVETARAELQQRAQALEEANVRLQELDRLKSQFLANMSHELRTPLNSIIGFSEVLVDGLVGEMPPEQMDCVRDIHSSGDHLLALINDILDISKIEAGRMELEATTVDPADLLAGVQATISSLIEKKSQVLKIELEDDLPSLIADPFRLKQVLLNLLSNANKFTPTEGQITLSCRLADQATMLFSVADTGIGIKPEDQEIIFEEFRQADGSAAREITGTGLGLTISKRLIEIHGGHLWVESDLGHGATFSFLLPIANPPAKEAESSEETGLLPDSKTVLVVEDDRRFSNLLAFYLRQEGYTPVQHYSGAGVLERARELRPALITLDIVLPERDGWDILRDLKSDQQTKDIPVLFISGLEDGELACSLGAVDYLVKPVRREDLQVLLDKLIPPEPLVREATVLVVDDDPGLFPLLQAMLPAELCTLLPALDGKKGLTLAHSEHPDAILLDLLMPGMSGFEVLEKLRADVETADIPVIVLTAKDVTREERKLLSEHTQGLMRKTTLTPQSLLAELGRLESLQR